MNYTEMLFNRDERLVNLLNQADSKNLELIEEINKKDKEINRLNKEYERIYNENCKLRENHNINDITLLDENERLNNIIKELSKDVDMWNKKYNEQFDIISELEKWVKEDVKEEKPDLYFQVLRKIDILDKLKELKENNK